ncbi:copper chaperone PCu(A)C [Fodinicurvata halophila]|uniref:copper chaperone PCu(A)C n=1 Tax=Fodinicurvata halophila TaxID=1419723 RepID=UPI0036341B27
MEITPGQPYAMAPWRPHIWVVGLKEPLEEGDSLELTLDFGGAGQKTVEVEIEEDGSH